MTDILTELEERHILAQVSDRSGLAAHLNAEPRVLYCGFDPTAPSLHVGNLVPLLTLRRFQLAGHRPIALVGGATGLIGDPSGTTQERSLNDSEVVADWVERLQVQVSRFLDFDGDCAARVVNNLDWTSQVSVLDFLRDVGKHFSINAMTQRDSVKERLSREGEGISFTEFSYMLLQANDYVELARRYDCSLQIGGSDQWGNIVSGVDLVRRVLRQPSFAATFELLVKSDGTKFGKTAGGAVWLDPELKSPYSFYQYFLNAADDDVLMLLDRLTFTDREQRAAAAESLQSEPQARAAQRLLAGELTSMVHGDSELKSAERISAALFGGELQRLEENDLEQLWQDGLDRVSVGEDQSLAGIVADAGLAQSRGAARRLIKNGGVSVNGEVVADKTSALARAQALFGKFHLLRRGRKTWCIVGYE